MSYRNCIYNKKSCLLFLIFITFEHFRFSMSSLQIFLVFVECFGFVEIQFGVFGVLCITNCCFECVYRIRCTFLYIGTDSEDMFQHFWKMSQKCEQFSYEILFCYFLRLLRTFSPKWSPTQPPSPSLASMPKFPSRRKRMKKMFV